MKRLHNWVSTEEILKGLGRNEEESRINYRCLIMERCGQERKILEEIRYGLILGSDKFVDLVKKRFVKREEIDSELPQRKMLRDDGVREKVLDAVIKGFGVEREELIKRKRFRQQTARDVAIYILHNHTELSNKGIGKVFNVSPIAIGKASMRIRDQMREDKELKKEVESIINSAFEV